MNQELAVHHFFLDFGLYDYFVDRLTESELRVLLAYVESSDRVPHKNVGIVQEKCTGDFLDLVARLKSHSECSNDITIKTVKTINEMNSHLILCSKMKQ